MLGFWFNFLCRERRETEEPDEGRKEGRQEGKGEGRKERKEGREGRKEGTSADGVESVDIVWK